MASDLRRLMEVSASITSEIRLDALLRNVVEAWAGDGGEVGDGEGDAAEARR